jgi:hypothetical protein
MNLKYDQIHIRIAVQTVFVFCCVWIESGFVWILVQIMNLKNDQIHVRIETNLIQTLFLFCCVWIKLSAFVHNSWVEQDTHTQDNSNQYRLNKANIWMWLKQVQVQVFTQRRRNGRIDYFTLSELLCNVLWLGYMYVTRWWHIQRLPSTYICQNPCVYIVCYPSMMVMWRACCMHIRVYVWVLSTYVCWLHIGVCKSCNMAGCIPKASLDSCSRLMSQCARAWYNMNTYIYVYIYSQCACII